MYFRLYSDKYVAGMKLIVTEIKQANEKNQQIYDLMDTLQLVRSFGLNDKFYSIKL